MSATTNLPVWLVVLVAFVSGCSLTANIFQESTRSRLTASLEACRRDLRVAAEYMIGLFEYARDTTAKLARKEGTLEWLQARLPEKLKAVFDEMVKVAQAKANVAKDFEDAGVAALKMADQGFMSGQPANEVQPSAPGRKQA